MTLSTNSSARSRVLAAVLLLTTLNVGAAFDADIKVTLSGANEVPPVATPARGGGTITVEDDGSILGGFCTAGVAGIAAHIHEGAAGTNGPAIVPLTKDGDYYKVPGGAKFTAAQMARFEAGELYINVQSAENPGGEIRGQLK